MIKHTSSNDNNNNSSSSSNDNDIINSSNYNIDWPGLPGAVVAPDDRGDLAVAILRRV